MASQQQQQQPPANRWHVDRGVNLAHLLTTVSLIAAVAVGWFRLQERVAVLEVRALVASAAQEEAKRDIAQLVSQIRSDIADLRREIREQRR